MGSLLFQVLLLFIFVADFYTCAGFYRAHYSCCFVWSQSWWRLLFSVFHLDRSCLCCNSTLLWLGSGGPRAFSPHSWGSYFVARHLRFAIYRLVLSHSSSGHLLCGLIIISLWKPSFNVRLPWEKLWEGWWFLCCCRVVFGHISSEIWSSIWRGLRLVLRKDIVGRIIWQLYLFALVDHCEFTFFVRFQMSIGIRANLIGIISTFRVSRYRSLFRSPLTGRCPLCGKEWNRHLSSQPLMLAVELNSFGAKDNLANLRVLFECFLVEPTFARWALVQVLGD